jgi:hypothetical protein
MARLPTPASPTSRGLFFCRRAMTCSRRRSSPSLPTMGSKRSLLASSMRSRVKRRARWPSPPRPVAPPPPPAETALCVAHLGRDRAVGQGLERRADLLGSSTSRARNTAPAKPVTSAASASRRCRTRTCPPSRAASALGARGEPEHPGREVRDGVGHLLNAPHHGLALDQQVTRVDPGALEGLLRQGVAVEQSVEQMEALDLGVPALVGEALRAREGGLGVRGVTFELPAVGAST